MIMKNTDEKALLQKAKDQLAADLLQRGYGAVLWDLATAGFHFIPEISLTTERGSQTVRVTGVYAYDGHIYAIEEDKAGVNTDQFYTPGVDVPPVVVTLTPDKAAEVLGDPTKRPGFTSEGSTAEWLSIADAYFEALKE